MEESLRKNNADKIQLQMIFTAKISFYKKLHLIILLGASVFVMVAATLRVMFVFKVCSTSPLHECHPY